MAETVLEVERDETGTYIGAYYGDGYDFVEYSHENLAGLMGLFHDNFSNLGPIAWANEDGIVVQHTVKAEVPWSRVAEVALNSPQSD